MSVLPNSLSTYIILLSTLLFAYSLVPIKALDLQRKLDETELPVSSDPSIKCGGCPCGHTCYQSPPPPSPPPPSPPPPPKKPPSSSYCPPPPYTPASPGGGFVYVGGPPGQLYPIDPSYSGSSKSVTANMKIQFWYGLLGLLIFLT